MNNKLNKYSDNITSQHGEDGILQYIVDSIGDKVVKVCCEFGAWDGIFASNCYNLWKNKKWEALLIEGDKDKFQDLIENIEGHDNVQGVCSYVAPHGDNSLDDIFARNNWPNRIGVLSIDIDSFDYHVWKNIYTVSAQVIIIEHNLFIPGYIDYHDPGDEVFLRSSAKALERLGGKKGYKLICCTLSNSIFIRSDLFSSKHFPDFPVEYLFDYSAVQSQILMTGTNNNRFPVFSKKLSRGRKFLNQFYYKVQSLIKSDVEFIKPSPSMKKHLRKFGLDA